MDLGTGRVARQNRTVVIRTTKAKPHRISTIRRIRRSAVESPTVEPVESAGAEPTVTAVEAGASVGAAGATVVGT